MGARVHVADQHAGCCDHAADDQHAHGRDPLKHLLATQDRLLTQLLAPGIGLLCGGGHEQRLRRAPEKMVRLAEGLCDGSVESL